jgi:diguanylate cyclase (GGDEF)-like protein
MSTVQDRSDEGAEMNGVRVLYIEDDPTQARLVERLLTRGGAQVELAGSGEQGFAALETRTFDIVVTDYQLLGCDGLEVVATVKARYPNLPVIMLSGMSDLQVVVKAMQLGAADYVIKDVPGAYLDLLPTAIERVLDTQRIVEEKRRAEAALEEERTLSRMAVDQMAQGLAIYDRELVLRLCNRQFLALLELPEHLGRRGTPFSDILEFRKTCGGFLGGVGELEIRKRLGSALLNASFRYERILPSGRVLEIDGGPMPDGGVFITLTDVTEYKRIEDRIRHLAQHDTLTGLPNRLMFHEVLPRALAQSRRSGEGLALLFIDLDGFKAVNDGRGHEAGDELLRQVAARLQATLREADLVARLGGDEFVVLLTGVRDSDAAETAADHIITAVSQPYVLPQGEALISASIGIARFPQVAIDPDELLNKADQAMYLAKAAGKGCYRFSE